MPSDCQRMTGIAYGFLQSVQEVVQDMVQEVIGVSSAPPRVM
jgi:hypothetical protein